jgi:lipopolysaccharide/colanic/teichoic acid biosynthesis glycosyltransferase
MSKTLYKKIKRFLDILFSLLLLTLFSPLFLLITAAIWITDRCEICIRDPLRIGLNGSKFRMYKFRTMHVNAHDEILNNPKYAKLKKKWETNGNKLKIEEDPRITKVGRLLRKTDLDELPQLINVLKGEMSLVGPRPMYEDEIIRFMKKNTKGGKYSNEKLKQYLKNISKVRPGITGMWQVSGRNEIPFDERLRMDSEYAQSQNFWDDFKILLKTPYIVLTRKGAYE